MIAPLYPFSLLYDGITRGRNHLYDRGWARSFGFDRMLISVGNLSVGGTGKTPMVEYLVRLLQPNYPLAILSRGYKRSTKGFRLANARDNASTLGDEPYQYYRKWEGALPVAVGEDRAMAITYLLKERPEVKIILLDDAYQHRRIRPDLNLLLTTYQQPFWKDYLLPAGRLRESRKGAKRAHALIVTKCPEDLSPEVQQQCEREAAKYLYPGAAVFFSTIAYEEPLPVSQLASKAAPKKGVPVILLSGLANARPLEAWVKQHYELLDHHEYGDHHQFTPAELERLQHTYSRYPGRNAIILTSEKDSTRLLQPQLEPLLRDLPLYYIPIRQRFLKDSEAAVNSLILKSVEEKLRYMS